jgi:uncharacterized OsmC-like protein
MRLILEGEDRVRLTEVADAGFEIESVADVALSPFHMLAGSMATCTASVLAAWAVGSGLDTAGLQIGLGWDYAEDPYRVGRIQMEIRWPDLPEGRRAAALRAAEHCTVTQTLRHPPMIETRVSG